MTGLIEKSIFRTRRIASLLLLGTVFTIGLPLPVLAAKWTEIVIAVGAYESMLGEFRTTGSSDEVNVLVWHNPDLEMGNRLNLYSVKKDPNPDNPPGLCCPNEGDTCCEIEEIPPSELGVTSGRMSAANFDKLLTYAATAFPAEHYVIAFRGVPLSNSVILVKDLSLGAIRDSIRLFNDKRGGKKVDVLSLSFCLAGNADWSHNFKDVANVYIGPPNYTNPPVAARWRVHRWARVLIRNPDMDGPSLASEIIRIFKHTTDVCIEQGHNCSNLSEQEPWTIGAMDLTFSPAYTKAIREFICAYLPIYDTEIYKQTLNKTTRYGYIPGGQTDWNKRYDIKHFLMNLKSESSEPKLLAAIDNLLQAHETYVIESAVEPTGFFEQAYGLSVFFNNDYSTAEKIGPFMYDSLWKALTRKIEYGTDLPSGEGIAIEDPNKILRVGDKLSLTTIDTSSEYGLMCASTGIMWQVSDINLATIEDPTANPASLVAIAPGIIQVDAIKGDFQDTISIEILEKIPDDDDDPDDLTSGGCGCSMGKHQPLSMGNLVLLGVIVVFIGLLRMRRRIQ